MGVPIVFTGETVPSIHHALGRHDIVKSFINLSSIVKSNMKRKSEESAVSQKRLKRRYSEDVVEDHDHDTSEKQEGSSSDLEDEDEMRFGHVFQR